MRLHNLTNTWLIIRIKFILLTSKNTLFLNKGSLVYKYIIQMFKSVKKNNNLQHSLNSNSGTFKFTKFSLI